MFNKSISNHILILGQIVCASDCIPLYNIDKASKIFACLYADRDREYQALGFRTASGTAWFVANILM